ncbi:hypothetical protein SAMN04489712_11292 [Thermomonospora echinospora]|uniref:Outer membrane channel protein CpnT-like N-terminal domain-containing protein n=1 Tax=Thermomonospora echinospora TaxID=1992 RepID=A0A1H6D197_9ACTN|nr:hypothetical protein [Thermomonospora echinospora]SEG78565.1 hypothetical protein SAMN04489712_11292 [Thermomonospora echinospora]
MGLVLPGQLAGLLEDLGYFWPNSDETKMLQMGQLWMEHGGKVSATVQQADQAVQSALSSNQGQGMEAFKAKWEAEDSAHRVAQDGVSGARVIGAALFACAMIVLALKITVIIQLTLLLIQIIQAIAASVATFGASLAWIPVAKKLADLAINFAISKAVEALLGS